MRCSPESGTESARREARNSAGEGSAAVWTARGVWRANQAPKEEAEGRAARLVAALVLAVGRKESIFEVVVVVVGG